MPMNGYASVVLSWVTLHMCLGAAPSSCPAASDQGHFRCTAPPAVRYEFGGMLGDRIQANVQQWLLAEPYANPGMLNMFLVRDRQPEPDLVPWAGEFVGKYLMSAVQAQRMVRNEALNRTVRDVVDRLIAAQADDGYLGPFKKSERLLGHWDLWGHYHVMLALMMYSEDAGYAPAMQACRKAAELICRTYLDQPRRVFDAGSQEMNMAVIHAMARLYRLTREERFLLMARHVEKDWERAGDYLRTGVAGVPFFRTPRPRWESLHDLQGLLEMYCISGQPQYRQALANHWLSIARLDRHNSGSFSTGEGAIGNPYLPGAIETCCTTAWIALTNDYLQLTGDSTAADELEWSTYNAVPAAQHPSGRWWTYDTPMDGARAASAHSIVFQARPGTPELNCCSVNGPRGLGMLSEWAIQVDANGPIVNHYGPCRAWLKLPDGTDLSIVQETQYPASGSIRLTIEPRAAATFDLRLRVPAWSRQTSIAVNGKALPGIRPATYFSVKREWKSGDVVSLTLDMRPRCWAGECEQAGRASVYRGPLLLAFDPQYNAIDCDHVPAVDPNNIVLSPVPPPADAVFKPTVLFGVTAANGETVKLCDFATAGAYGNAYRSWLPSIHADASANDWMTYRFDQSLSQVHATDPDGILVAAPLDAKPDPSRGRLQQAIDLQPAADRRGQAGGAVSFNGRSSRLVYELAGFPNDFTACAWVRVNSVSPKTYQQVFSAWTAGSSDPLRISIMGDQISARIEAGTLYATAGVKIETGRWFHVAAVKAGEQLRLYIDGQLQQSAAAPACTCSNAVRNFALGANPNYSGDEYLDGCIDDFTLYAKPLSAQDIRKVFEGG